MNTFLTSVSPSDSFYCLQTKFAKVMVLQVSVCPRGWGCVWLGGMHGRGACVADMHGKGGGMHGRGHSCRGACMVGGMHGRGTCMAGGCVWQAHPHPTPGRYYEIQSMSGRYASYWNAFLLYNANTKPYNIKQQVLSRCDTGAYIDRKFIKVHYIQFEQKHFILAKY